MSEYDTSQPGNQMRAQMQADATLPRHSYALGRMLFSDDV